MAKGDLERAINEVQYVNDMIEELKRQQEEYQTAMSNAQENYENKTTELEHAFNEATAAELAQFQKEIMDAFNAFKETFGQTRKTYNAQLSSLIESIQIKRFGLSIS